MVGPRDVHAQRVQRRPAPCGHAPVSARLKQAAFTLVELLVVVVIVAVLARIASPLYTQQIIRASREAAQSQLLELSNLQEKIFLNQNLYTGSISNAYTGLSSGGLGVTGSATTDAKYTLSLSPTTASSAYTLTATPVTGTSQVGDGNLSINQNGTRVWGSASW